MPQDFAREVLTRLPLAEAVLTLWRWVVDPLFLLVLFARQRGAGYEKVLSFARLVQLIAEALLAHRGSGRKRLTRARENGQLEARVQAVYQQLGRVPLGLSEAWLAESTARGRPVYPAAAMTPVPPAVQECTVLVVEGKASKTVAQRLKPRQGRKGGSLGGKALVALAGARGLAVALATQPDGETNAAKLVPALLPQVRTRVAGPRLGVAARQCCDLTQRAALATEPDHFVVRYHPKTHFCPATTRTVQHGADPQGRAWVEDWGWWGCERAPKRRFVRRITLYRPGEDTVSLLPDLLDAAQSPANALLALYLARWGIERGFQQITEGFHLQALMGTTPQGTVFRLAVCLLLYHLRQGVRAYVATAQARPPETLSTELLFDEVQRHLVALTELLPPPALEPLFEPLPSPDSRCGPLTRLRETVWTPRWLKAPAKNPNPPTTRKAGHGNQTSV